MKIYADIILSGEYFDPECLHEKYGCNFRKYNKKGDYNPRLKNTHAEGYGILTIENDCSESVIDKLMEQYEKIYNIGEDSLGIEEKEFHLYFEALQNSITISTKNLARIEKYFDKINITFIPE